MSSKEAPSRLFSPWALQGQPSLERPLLRQDTGTDNGAGVPPAKIAVHDGASVMQEPVDLFHLNGRPVLLSCSSEGLQLHHAVPHQQQSSSSSSYLSAWSAGAANLFRSSSNSSSPTRTRPNSAAATCSSKEQAAPCSSEGQLAEEHEEGIERAPLNPKQQDSSAAAGQWQPGELLLAVPYEELVSARYLPTRRLHPEQQQQQQQRKGARLHIQSAQPAPLVHHLELGLLRRAGRFQPAGQWRLQLLELTARDLDAVRGWASTLNCELTSQRHRPRRLLVFVNPFGGKRRAQLVWSQLGAPVFDRCHIDYQVIETQSAGHARCHVANLPPRELQCLDGIIAVGGDGLFAEVLLGLTLQPAQAAVAGLRLGHVPAGSTDAVACTLNGTRDPLTALLHIVLGDGHPLDVALIAATKPKGLPAATTPTAAAAAAGGGGGAQGADGSAPGPRQHAGAALVAAAAGSQASAWADTPAHLPQQQLQQQPEEDSEGESEDKPLLSTRPGHAAAAAAGEGAGRVGNPLAAAPAAAAVGGWGGPGSLPRIRTSVQPHQHLPHMQQQQQQQDGMSPDVYDQPPPGQMCTAHDCTAAAPQSGSTTAGVAPDHVCITVQQSQAAVDTSSSNSSRARGVYSSTAAAAAGGSTSTTGGPDTRHSTESQSDLEDGPMAMPFVCVANYGFLGDVLHLSERLRWVGPARYDVAGVLRLLLLRSYDVTLTYLPAEEVAPASPSTHPVSHQVTTVGAETAGATSPSASAVAGAGGGGLSDTAAAAAAAAAAAGPTAQVAAAAAAAAVSCSSEVPLSSTSVSDSSGWLHSSSSYPAATSWQLLPSDTPVTHGQQRQEENLGEAAAAAAAAAATTQAGLGNSNSSSSSMEEDAPGAAPAPPAERASSSSTGSARQPVSPIRSTFSNLVRAVQSPRSVCSAVADSDDDGIQMSETAESPRRAGTSTAAHDVILESPTTTESPDVTRASPRGTKTPPWLTRWVRRRSRAAAEAAGGDVGGGATTGAPSTSAAAEAAAPPAVEASVGSLSVATSMDSFGCFANCSVCRSASAQREQRWKQHAEAVASWHRQHSSNHLHYLSGTGGWTQGQPPQGVAGCGHICTGHPCQQPDQQQQQGVWPQLPPGTAAHYHQQRAQHHLLLSSITQPPREVHSNWQPWLQGSHLLALLGPYLPDTPPVTPPRQRSTAGGSRRSRSQPGWMVEPLVCFPTASHDGTPVAGGRVGGGGTCPAPAAAVQSSTALPGGWRRLRGKYTSIMCAVTSCRSDRSTQGLAPCAHLADGRLVLVLVKQCSRLQYLRFLLLLSRRGVWPGMLPYVDVLHVTSLKVQSHGRVGYWNVDGELMRAAGVQLGVLPAAVQVFARGVERV